MKLLIRDARPEDAAGVVAIFNPIIESGLYTSFDTPFTVEAERDYILNMTERHIFHVAVNQEDERIVGFQSVGTAQNHLQVNGRYLDEIIIEKLL